MAYVLPVGDALVFDFVGRAYTPPEQADQLEMFFLVGLDIDYPVPPSLRVQSRTRWQQSVANQQATQTLWKEGHARDGTSHIRYAQAESLPASGNTIGWDTVSTKDDATSTAWGTPTPEETKTNNPWTNTRPTDPQPTNIPWDKPARPKQTHTDLLWGQPPAKDQIYGGPWFRVDTTSPPWQLNDHRQPPLWSDPPDKLAFQFEDSHHRPDKVPQLWFRFEGHIPLHAIQPKDPAPKVHWQQAAKRDVSPSVLWGEGRTERIKDRQRNLRYGAKVKPLPLKPPKPDDKECYLLMNTVNAVRLPDNEPLELLDITIDLDIDSFTWQLSASVANKAILALIEPDASGTKDIKVTINGWDWVFMVTRYDTERSFNNEQYRISGESRTRLLAAPYAPSRTKTETNDIAAVQAAEAELTNTGFTLNWDSTETWATPDWIIPGGTFSYVEQTPMQVIAQIANTAGAVVIPLADSDALALQPRYKISPWNWLEDTTPIDHAIPESMVLSMSVEWRPEPEYNAVYVSGIYVGVAVDVQRSGTAGDSPAPDIIEDWLTEVDVNTERGRNVLSEGGPQAVVSLELPLTVKGQPPGLVHPGQLVEVMEGTEPWIGLCLATSVSTTGSGAGRVAQSLSVERHYGND